MLESIEWDTYARWLYSPFVEHLLLRYGSAWIEYKDVGLKFVDIVIYKINEKRTKERETSYRNIMLCRFIS